MSIIPYIIEDLYPTNYCGVGYYPSDLFITPIEQSLIKALSKPSVCLGSQLSSPDKLEKYSHVGKDGFQVCLDVQHFAPNEISVKTVDNSIVVEGKHEERKDEHGFISRQFTRRYALPEGFRAEDVVSSLSSDGVLTLKAPPATPAVEGNVRHVQIQQTGPAHLNVTNKPKNSKEA